ncbi:bifunctional enzyme IspD/IspF [Candidatus Phycosocius spiralis]|uniref:2-C-methyl-D-erythritol 2,4-cyclodiphosphate synthase n=1 Tax=Candidatus Phycosocius spiralis TaxID=2815099 RepID=A0ABQ4PTB9_9PROT|nr:bifunctional enzyme IspD/IspF [Candidatus Phycosocius spiralis]
MEAFARDPRFGPTIVVCDPKMRDKVAHCAVDLDILYADSGQTRTQSVASGLKVAQETNAQFYFIHDAARPGLDQSTLDALFKALEQGSMGAVPALPLADALWRTHEQHLVAGVDRYALVRVQTPQAFVGQAIGAAYAHVAEEKTMVDDVAVAQMAGLTVSFVKGSPRLDKITWHEDFAHMTQVLAPTFLPRTGSGFDAHRFGEGAYVTLCGVQIPHCQGLVGHSDADVAWHCLADALYGALSAGDIGKHFPPSEPKWRGAGSHIFLSHAAHLVREADGLINHLDLTIMCEQPKIGPHREAMIATTASLLGLAHHQVSIKATTTEGMGFTGRREGIAAQACVTILLPTDFSPFSL